MLLVHLVQTDDQSAQVLPFEVLHLVDRDQDPLRPLAGGFSDLREQARQVFVQKSRIRPAGHGIKAHRYIATIRQVPPHLERLEHTERPLGPIGQVLRRRKAQEHLPDEFGHRLRKPYPLTRLKRLTDPVSALAQAAKLPQQHGLSHAAKSSQNHALGETAKAQALNGDADRLELGIPTDKRWWRASGTRAVGVPDRVHRSIIEICLAFIDSG